MRVLYTSLRCTTSSTSSAARLSCDQKPVARATSKSATSIASPYADVGTPSKDSWSSAVSMILAHVFTVAIGT